MPKLQPMYKANPACIRNACFAFDYRAIDMAVIRSYISNSLGKFLSQSARSSTIRRLRSENNLRSSGVRRAAQSSRLANPSAEFTGASHPLKFSVTHSRLEGISVNTTGSPVAIASNNEIDVPSDCVTT